MFTLQYLARKIQPKLLFPRKQLKRKTKFNRCETLTWILEVHFGKYLKKDTVKFSVIDLKMNMVNHNVFLKYTKIICSLQTMALQ